MEKSCAKIAYWKDLKLLSKEEYVRIITQNGYTATLESGVIILTLDSEKSLKKAFNDVRSMGYKSSLGARIKGACNGKEKSLYDRNE